MKQAEWVSICADRLQQQWPHAPREELEDIARTLYAQDHWRELRADDAAATWLKRGSLFTNLFVKRSSEPQPFSAGSPFSQPDGKAR